MDQVPQTNRRGDKPAGLDLHLIADNYARHEHARVKAWLRRHPQFQIHFKPTSSSWLNLIERWFRDGVFRSVVELEAVFRNYIDHHNANPSSFAWTKKAKDILEKVTRARASLDKIPSA